jgi:hypothetical protein
MILITVTTFRSCHVLVINLKAFFLLPSTAEEAPLKPYRRRSSPHPHPQPQGLSRPPPAAVVVPVLRQRGARSLLSPPRPQSLAIEHQGTSLFSISTISGCLGAHPRASARHLDPLCCLTVVSCCSCPPMQGKHGEVGVDFPPQGARAIVPRVQHRGKWQRLPQFLV